MRAIDTRPQLRGGGSRQSLVSQRSGSEPSTSAPSGLGDILEHPRREISVASTASSRPVSEAIASVSSGGGYYSALESPRVVPLSRPSTITERTEPTSSIASAMTDQIDPISPSAGSRATVMTSREDIDERLRRMKEDFARGMDRVTEAKRQHQERREITTTTGESSQEVEESYSTSDGAQGSPRLTGSPLLRAATNSARGSGLKTSSMSRVMPRDREDSATSSVVGGGASGSGSGGGSGMGRRAGSTGTFDGAFGGME